MIEHKFSYKSIFIANIVYKPACFFKGFNLKLT